ncbi:MAG: hypothetical protein C5S49_04260 [Candidatus Methanogaster sp.]|nr:MAG: hypothetical protein C5S49_04260 [ANME-2 cluster archaeon]
MNKNKKTTIEVKGAAITVLSQKEDDYICITDIARYKNTERTDDLVRNWLRNRNTIEFLGIWEQLNNPGFKPVEFDGIRMQAGLNSFTLTPKQWIEKTGVVGVAGYELVMLDRFLSGFGMKGCEAIIMLEDTHIVENIL